MAWYRCGGGGKEYGKYSKTISGYPTYPVLKGGKVINFYNLTPTKYSNQKLRIYGADTIEELALKKGEVGTEISAISTDGSVDASDYKYVAIKWTSASDLNVWFDSTGSVEFDTTIVFAGA